MSLQSDNLEDQLLQSRILFLLSYGNTLDFNQLFDENELAETINMVYVASSISDARLTGLRTWLVMRITFQNLGAVNHHLHRTRWPYLKLSNYSLI